ncbi:D-alanyl-D-alanine carboxypeptidase family protein [Laedolimicola ammoniilytica]|uniref:serine-type D-Ala-D-Ala carboxypeptidase n=1 Tax=Laedolimicola ammoniilytica TaxID=2981771 RepID=A0ABT2S1A5_9FIRM|nr:D-alanyl-D-alanine carboxypeptidase family protein [Laedolimicola ammoniilytica]MCU6698389.1 D-alanyl-D-alanine carboxypeptidase [Laedolimicola ammoniilytica]SCI79425.1 D-alanyl-D-alanine carboxypeptidase dacB precursor [uncultured Clostridium sp.]
MKKLLAFSLTIFLFFQLFLTVSPTEVLAAPADEVLTLHAQSAVLMDGDTGRILYAKNAGKVRPMASTTKIMTLILALENGNPDDLVTVSAYAASMPDVQLHIRAGEKYRLGDLLYSMMLESHNDAAVAIAEHVGGTVPGFAALMNAKARDIGCYSTYYVTPNGLDAEDGNGVHSTTAADLARVMRYCITLSPRREEFLKITRTDSYSFGDTEGLRSFTVGNKNAFLHMMEGALTGKTGFTGNAGYCYVGALRQEERTFIVALLACGWPNNRSYKWSDTRKLMNYGLEHFTYRNVWQEPKLPELPVKNGIPDRENLEEEARIRLRLSSEEPDLKLLLSEGEQVQVETHISQEVTAPVEPGTLLGSVRYLLDGQVVKVYTVEAAEDVEAVTLDWCLEKLWRKYIP